MKAPFLVPARSLVPRDRIERTSRLASPEFTALHDPPAFTDRNTPPALVPAKSRPEASHSRAVMYRSPTPLLTAAHEVAQHETRRHPTRRKTWLMDRLRPHDLRSDNPGSPKVVSQERPHWRCGTRRRPSGDRRLQRRYRNPGILPAIDLCDLRHLPGVIRRTAFRRCGRRVEPKRAKRNQAGDQQQPKSTRRKFL